VGVIGPRFKLQEARVDVFFEAVSDHHGVIGGIGIDGACIGKECAASDKTSSNALPHDAQRSA